MELSKKNKNIISILKAVKKRSRDDEIAMFGKQVSMYRKIIDKKRRTRGGKHKKKYLEDEQ